MRMDPTIRERARAAFLKYWSDECGLAQPHTLGPVDEAPQAGSLQMTMPVLDEPSAGLPETLMLDDLLALVYEFSQQPVASLRPVIRLLVLERMYLDHAGDSMADGLDDQAAEDHVDTIVRVLEKVRQQALLRGQAINCPVPPLMCG